MSRFKRFLPFAVFAILMALSIGNCLAIGFGNCGELSGHAVWTAIHTVSSCALVALLAVLMGRWSLVFMAPLLAWLTIWLGVEIFLKSHFVSALDSFSGEWLAVLMNSSPREVLEFMRGSMLVGDWLLIFSQLALFGGYLWLVWRLEHARRERRLYIAAAVAALVTLAGLIPAIPNCSCLAHAVAGHPFLTNATRTSCFDELGVAGRPLERGAFAADTMERGVMGVVVIGESALRAHMSLYGYGRVTTPRMDALRGELVVFGKVRADAWLTTNALLSFLTDHDSYERHEAEFSVPSAAESAGYATALVSAQNHWLGVDGVDGLLFRTCPRKVFLTDIVEDGPVYDSLALPHLAGFFSEAEADGSSAVAFVHSIGSHRLFAERYPAEFSRFAPGFEDEETSGLDETARALVNAYDNTILFTDHVLGEIVESMRAMNRPAFVLYFSDHGESPSSTTRTDSESLREVPMFVWFSPEYKEDYPEVVADVTRHSWSEIPSDKTLPIFLELLRINKENRK
ncbi:MAG: phosphoethanolamine transferase [Lentisphaerae bacterium]|nr:phosphoethanolamine transferase [Lentisphaerota bacterium]